MFTTLNIVASNETSTKTSNYNYSNHSNTTAKITELSNIEKLPSELLYHIFSFLSDEPQQLLTMGAVSHSFRTLSSDHTLWKKFEPLLNDYQNFHTVVKRCPATIRDSFIKFNGFRKSDKKRKALCQERRKQLSFGPGRMIKSNAFSFHEKFFFILFSQCTATLSLASSCLFSIFLYILQTSLSASNSFTVTLAPILSYLLLFVIYTIGPKASKYYADLSYRTVDSIMTVPALLIFVTLFMGVMNEDFFYGLNIHVVLFPVYILAILSGFSVYIYQTSCNDKKSKI